jgi:hypothetical protein
MRDIVMILEGLPLDMRIFLLLINYIKQLARIRSQMKEIIDAVLDLIGTESSDWRASTGENKSIIFKNVVMLTLLALLIRLKYPP